MIVNGHGFWDFRRFLYSTTIWLLVVMNNWQVRKLCDVVLFYCKFIWKLFMHIKWHKPSNTCALLSWFSNIWFTCESNWLWRDCSFTVKFSSGCLKLIPHNKFSFAKIWILAAQFEIRQLNLKAARNILGNAIGKAPKDKVI